jgi:hypothetical protein
MPPTESRVALPLVPPDQLGRNQPKLFLPTLAQNPLAQTTQSSSNPQDLKVAAASLPLQTLRRKPGELFAHLLRYCLLLQFIRPADQRP